MLDRFFAILVLVIFSPLFLLIIFSIILEGVFRSKARGPLFYIEDRVSRRQSFRIIKFRTFSPNILDKPSISNDRDYGITAFEHKKENITFTGEFLKKFYLDELPQLFNIIKGDMCFVGPRPLIRPLYEDHVNKGNKAKIYLKAGWTGPWQSQKGHIRTLEDIVKAENDYYMKVEGMNFFHRFICDLNIIGRTCVIIFEGKSI